MARPLLSFIAVTSTRSPLWRQAMALYRAAFPRWERDPEADMVRALENGSYRLVVGCSGNEVAAFYLLFIGHEPRYTLLAYLVVDSKLRGHKIGSRLCRHAMENYRQYHPESRGLFIEAEARQAKLYDRLGFYRLPLDYQVPHFDSATASTSMSLMFWRQPFPESLSADTLVAVVTHLFTHGYRLSPTDARLQQQLRRITGDIPLA